MAVSAVLGPAVTATSSLDRSTLSPPADPQRTPSSSLSASSPSSPSSPQQGDSSLSSSPRYQSTELPHPILEEGDESESDSPNEPVTPVSGRQSQDFHALQTNLIHHDSTTSSDGTTQAYNAIRPEATPASKTPIILNTAATPPPPKTPTAETPRPPTSPSDPYQDSPPTPLSRRTTRNSATGLGFKRTMSSFFKRANSGTDKSVFGFGEPGYNAASESNLAEGQMKAPTRRYSMNRMHKSTVTTQSNTPPSPGSPPLEMNMPHKITTAQPTIPNHEDFFNNQSKKKNRASTGLSIHKAINFVTSSNGRNGDAKKVPPPRRRASSFENSKQQQSVHRAEPWALPAEAGTGLKARRMSLSLPDDFFVDTADLNNEYEYQHKMGRHRKHLGKGATSKVTLMFRKDCPGELYAVKEFRSKSSSETKEEYEKKVKSEFSIAKSLHHPNIVTTIRLCTDHGRWNHVMEYCSDGDLFSLVEKKYLMKDDREKDRQCLFKQLVQGLNYLHSNGIAHRDIKLENLLIMEGRKLKITDFGVSEVFSGTHPGLREAGGQCGQHMDGEVRLCSPGICGSMPYISPEVLAGKDAYDPRKLDVWGAGIVMLNLIFGAPIWKEAKVTNTNYAALVKGWDKWNAKHPEGEEITDGDYPKVPAFDFAINPPVLRRILLQMLNPDPKKRITIDKVANMRWMKGVECCQLETYDDPAGLIDASKKNCTKLLNGSKIFCHNHLPPQGPVSHSLGKMPGSAGY